MEKFPIPTDPLLEDGLVEVNPVQDDSPDVWYDAYLLDVQSDSQNDDLMILNNSGINTLTATVVLAIKDQPPSIVIVEQKHIRKFFLDRIRFKPKSLQNANFTKNNIIEVSAVEDDKFITWKLVKIKTCKGTHALVEYIHNDGRSIDPSKNLERLDIVDNQVSRAKNPFQPFNRDTSRIKNPFVRVEFPLPNYLQNNDFSWLSVVNFHDKFKKNVENLVNIHFNNERKSLICLGFPLDQLEFSKDKFINQCNLLSEWHFRALKDTHLLTKHLINKNNNENTLHLTIPRNLVGLAIGKNGANIRKARSLNGINSIELWNDINTFIIRGTSPEACNNAALLLNYHVQTIEVVGQHRDFFSNRRIMQEIVQKSGVIQFDLFTRYPKKEEQDDVNENKNNNPIFSLRLLGNNHTINNFKILLNFQLMEFQEIKKLEARYGDFFRDLKDKMSEVTLASSYNPLYPLKAYRSVVKSIFDLFELDIYQFMISVFGKTETFYHLQNRFEKNSTLAHYLILFALLGIFILFDWTICFIDFIMNELFGFNEQNMVRSSSDDDNHDDLLYFD